ncbi:ammonium transporter [Halothiobacillus sp.]|uniref:ammonium transporter n=1 Tax=Halothiobacillus sp. TaxID=1891311 RepID=UPI00262D218E|nr:ammonium transporter [Halothiobacillus sp.]
MKRLISLVIFLSVLIFDLPSFAADTTASTPPAAVAVTTEATPAAAPVALPDPTLNKGDMAWMIVATLLVVMMAAPGLGLFYGGMVRSKNMLSILMQTLVTFCLLGVLWAVYGYSLAFTEGNSFIGGFSKLFLQGVTPDSVAATFSKGVVIPEYIYIAFQLTFAAITPALIVGGFAERIKFTAVLAFMVLWFTFAYLPVAHMVWYWAGPDAYTTQAAADAASATAGFLFQKGVLDFAGGTVVHINAGIAALVGAYVIGKRIGYGKETMAPHSLTMTMIGGSLLWVGWFGFNVGSNLEANGVAGLVFMNTLLATCAATVSWSLIEGIRKGKPSMLGAVSGAISGLVVITPACGFVGPMGSIIMGFLGGLVCFWGVNGLKRWLGIDDTLDVFGVHCVGGILGAILTGVFAAPILGGSGVYDYVAGKVGDYNIVSQVITQFWGVGTTLIWSGLVAFIAFKLVDKFIGLRVSEEEEREGLDIASHGESAYHH